MIIGLRMNGFANNEEKQSLKAIEKNKALILKTNISLGSPY